MRKRLLSLALSLALCAGLATPALAAEYPQVTWLPEGVHLAVNPEIGELDACVNGFVIVGTGSMREWGYEFEMHGLVDRNGRPIEYSSLSTVSDELMLGTKDGKDYLINTSNGSVIPMEYDLAYDLYGNESEGMLKIEVQSGTWLDYIHKYGFIDTAGKLIVPPVYDWVSPFSEGLALVSNGEWGSASYAFVDKNGMTALDLGTTYQSVESFSEGLAVVTGHNGKQGAIDRSGQVVIPLEYDRLDSFSEGLAAAGKINGTDAMGDPTYAMGYIDKTGAVAIPFEYDWAEGFGDGLAVVGLRSGYAYDGFSDMYVPAYKYGLVDTAGKIAIPLVYDGVWYDWGTSKPFAGGVALAYRDGGFYLIDRAGNVLFSLKGDDVDSVDAEFADGVLAAYKGHWDIDAGMYVGESYVVDSSGNIIVPPGYNFKWRSPKYGEPGAFFDGVAAVGKDGKWGYMDRSGKILLPLEYDEVSYASGGVGAVRLGDRYGVVDLSAALTPDPVPAGTTAMPTNDALTSDGALQNPTVYKIDGSNYFKVRDLAAILNGTSKQFSVGYDPALSSVTVTTGEGYARLDGDLAGPPSGGEQQAVPSNDAIYINGERVEAQVYKIGGSNYFKLRDLGKALDFYVGYSEERGMFILTGQTYSE